MIDNSLPQSQVIFQKSKLLTKQRRSMWHKRRLRLRTRRAIVESSGTSCAGGGSCIEGEAEIKDRRYSDSPEAFISTQHSGRSRVQELRSKMHAHTSYTMAHEIKRFTYLSKTKRIQPRKHYRTPAPSRTGTSQLRTSSTQRTRRLRRRSGTSQRDTRYSQQRR
jgi:hypothetical protein